MDAGTHSDRITVVMGSNRNYYLDPKKETREVILLGVPAQRISRNMKSFVKSFLSITMLLETKMVNVYRCCHNRVLNENERGDEPGRRFGCKAIRPRLRSDTEATQKRHRSDTEVTRKRQADAK